MLDLTDCLVTYVNLVSGFEVVGNELFDFF